MVYIFLADGFEEIEAVVTIDILRRAEIDVITVSVSDSLEVTGSHNITVKADRVLKDLPMDGAEMLILPGGPGVGNLQKCEELRDITIKAVESGVLISAICAAPSVLGAWGLLQHKKAVCFPGYEDKLVGAIFTNQGIVNDGGVITSKGAGTAHDFAFEIVKVLREEELSASIRGVMQYV